MPIEVLKAIVTIVKFCMKQHKCAECPLKELCGKMPCEIDLF